MRAASAEFTPSTRIMFHTALAIFKSEPTSARIAVTHIPRATVTARPRSTKPLAATPTLGIASATSIHRSRGLQRSASRAARAPGQREYYVEQIRKACDARSEFCTHSAVGAVGMPRSDDYARVHQPRDHAGGVRSGVSVTRVRPRLRPVSTSNRSRSRRPVLSAGWMPCRAVLMNWPSMWTPSTPGTLAPIAASTAARAFLARLQPRGRALVLPIAVLHVAGLLLRLG